MTAPSSEFIDLVREALLRLYDVGRLQTHPLLALMADRVTNTATGSRLRQELLETIEALRPAPDVTPTARAWRLHHILELRYIECHTVIEVMEQVALSSAQYHREHQRALQMVATVLWERWRVAERWPVVAAPSDIDPIRREAAGLMHDRRGDLIDMAQVIHDLIRLLQPLYSSRGIDLHIVASPHRPAIAGERVAVRQLFLALLFHAGNAVEQATIRIQIAREAHQSVVAISGPATIAPEHLTLGLQEGRPFAEALQGTITLQPGNARQRSWTITVCLPSQERPSLLVVDNSADFIRLIELYLLESNWEVMSAGTVEEAARSARQRRPTVILLDVIIPGRDGWDLLLDLRNDSSTHDIPVIICSVLNEPRMATALGASAYLPKPVSQNQLLALLKAFP